MTLSAKHQERLQQDLIPKEHIDKIFALGSMQRFAERACLFKKGDAGTDLFLIAEGQVTISIHDASGRQVILNRLSAGDIFGEIALFDNQMRTADAHVEKGAVLVQLKREWFFNYLDRHPELYKSLLRMVCDRLRWCCTIIEDMSLYDGMMRVVSKIIQLQAKIKTGDNSTVAIAQDEFARMVNLSREAVNKNLKHLEQKGIIAVERRKIIVKDPDALATLLEKN